MSLEPPTASEAIGDDLSAARYWLDLAASNLPPGVFDGSNPEHLKIAVSLGDGYANLSHIERVRGWRAEDLERIDQVRREDLARVAEQREADFAQHEDDLRMVRERDQRALEQLQKVTAAVQSLPRGWRGALTRMARTFGGAS